MRALVWVGLVAACGKSAPHDAAVAPVARAPERAVSADAPVAARAGEWWQVALAALPTPADATGDPAARYAQAQAAARAANRDRALGILHGLAVEACETCSELVVRAMADDAFRPYWGSEAFRALIWSADRHREAGAAIACPAGTKQHGKLDDGGDGIAYCAKPDGTRAGPFVEHHSGCSLGEGGCGATGSYRDGKRDGVWVEGGTYEVTTMQVYVAGVATGLVRSWLKDVETWTFVDDRGRTDTTRIIDDGHVLEHGVAVDGKPDGAYERYAREPPHPLEEKGTYVRGKKDGAWLTYRDGRPRAEASYVLGIPHGTFRYWDAAGKLLATATIDRGTGAWVAYDGDMKIEEGALVNGVRDGAWLVADRDGSHAQGSYTRGSRDGHWSETANGVMAVGEYRAGARTGVWRLVDVFGKKIGEGRYAAGKRTGAWTFWHTTSTLLATGAFVADRPDGAWTIYGDDGVEVAQRLGFRAGVLATVDGKRATKGQVANASMDPPHIVEDLGTPPY